VKVILGLGKEHRIPTPLFILFLGAEIFLYYKILKISILHAFMSRIAELFFHNR